MLVAPPRRASCPEGPDDSRSEVRANDVELRVHSRRATTRVTAQSFIQSIYRSRYGAEIRALLAEPDAAPPEELRAHADKLKQIEDGLESA